MVMEEHRKLVTFEIPGRREFQVEVVTTRALSFKYFGEEVAYVGFNADLHVIGWWQRLRWAWWILVRGEVRP